VLAANKYSPEERLQPVMDALAGTVGETVHAAVREGRSIIHIGFAVPGPGPHFAVRPGERQLAHVTGLGKAMLATLTRDELLHLYAEEELTRSTGRGLASRSELLVELDEITRVGYSVEDEESRAGVRCIGAPIFGPNGKAEFAISVTSMPVRLSGERLSAVAREVARSGALATAAFGGTIPDGWGRSGRL
jgi:IclR family acetate operon transcriptional repressor